jgi:hypothetical protein
MDRTVFLGKTGRRIMYRNIIFQQIYRNTRVLENTNMWKAKFKKGK